MKVERMDGNVIADIGPALEMQTTYSRPGADACRETKCTLEVPKHAEEDNPSAKVDR
jgi:hypothetical protein